MSVRLLSSQHSCNQLEESTKTDNNDPGSDLALKVCIFSKFDSTIEISRAVWAATMVVEQGAFHVRLVFEGVSEKNQPFFRISHLQGPKTWRAPQEVFNCFFGWSKAGNVDAGKEIEHQYLSIDKYRKKTKTWARPREQIELVIEKIRAEESEQDKGNFIPFSFFGSRSILSQEVEFFKTDHPDLQSLQHSDPKQLAYLFALSRRHARIAQLTDRSEQNILTVLDNPIDGQNYRNNIDRMVGAVAYFSQGVLFAPPTQFIPAFLGLAGVVFVIGKIYTKSRIYVFNRAIETEKQHLDLINDHVHKITHIPNSCYTWAEDKLKMIDVQMPQGAVDQCIAISTLYVDQSI